METKRVKWSDPRELVTVFLEGFPVTTPESYFKAAEAIALTLKREPPEWHLLMAMGFALRGGNADIRNPETVLEAWREAEQQLFEAMQSPDHERVKAAIEGYLARKVDELLGGIVAGTELRAETLKTDRGKMNAWRRTAERLQELLSQAPSSNACFDRMIHWRNIAAENESQLWRRVEGLAEDAEGENGAAKF